MQRDPYNPYGVDCHTVGIYIRKVNNIFCAEDMVAMVIDRYADYKRNGKVCVDIVTDVSQNQRITLEMMEDNRRYGTCKDVVDLVSHIPGTDNRRRAWTYSTILIDNAKENPMILNQLENNLKKNEPSPFVEVDCNQPVPSQHNYPPIAAKYIPDMMSAARECKAFFPVYNELCSVSGGESEVAHIKENFLLQLRNSMAFY